jgi:toxin ParE1/3/4
MANRLIVSDRALREMGEAYEWYEEQVAGLGNEFLEALDVQFEVIAQSPHIYAETQRGVRRALLARFPYGIFYALKGDIVSILGVIHTARSPRRWPRRP